MKFDVIVGNPPYQVAGRSGGKNDAPIFQHFCRIANNVSNQYNSLLIPSRWFTAGRENLLRDFRNEMLSNSHIANLYVYTNSRDIFPNVEIKGGCCYYLEDKEYNGKCNYTLNRDNTKQICDISLNTFDVLIREPQLTTIVEKVQNQRIKNEQGTVNSIISSDTPFGIPSNPKTSKKSPFNVYLNSTPEHDVLLFHIEKGVRKVEFVSKSDVKKNQNDINTYKVFLTGAGGSGNDYKVMGKPEFAPIYSVCSQSYLYSSFVNEIEALNFIKYIETKFFRALVSAMKITQSAPSRVYRFVPLQNFDTDSDINWNQNVDAINRQLYIKYLLSENEITFIESMIKEIG